METDLKNDYPDKDAITKAIDLGINDFSRQNFSELNLKGITFPVGSDFSHSDFSNADLGKVVAPESIFRCAVLSGARLSLADFRDSNFFETIAKRVDFRRTNLSGADITSMQVNRAQFELQVIPWLPASIQLGVRLPSYIPSFIS
tara:strand:+ start:81 stop:515 length:435 start_codon:yes stop_codon:yes gene_type:complete